MEKRTTGHEGRKGREENYHRKLRTRRQRQAREWGRSRQVSTRASDPLIYWPVLLVAGGIAGLCFRKIWKGLTGKDEG